MHHYANCSNLAPAPAAAAASAAASVAPTAMNKKFLNLGKKRRRSQDKRKATSSSSSPERKRRRRIRHLEEEEDTEEEEEEDVNNMTDDEEFWSDLDGEVEGTMNEDEGDEDLDADDDNFDGDSPPGDRVAYIHVGEGGEADLEAQLKGAENLDIQILEEEDLPDIDETDMIHGLDHTGTARDYVDDRHRCTPACPVGCQGHLRPNEIVIYESFKWKGKLRGRRR